VIVVDTNVISELMRGDPHPAELSWVAAQPRSLLYTTSISQAEILHGIAALPEGRRRAALAAAA
jgi:predicted nucleic acid-binding protein